MEKTVSKTKYRQCCICKTDQIILKYHYGAISCRGCGIFFKRCCNLQLDDIQHVKDCTGSCLDKVKQCKQCRMRLCLANGMTLNHLHSKAQGSKLTMSEKSPKEKLEPAQKEPSSAGKKSKLSLKSSRQIQNCDDVSRPLDKWTNSNTQEPKAVNNPPEKMEKKVEIRETDVKVPCVASLHNLGNTCFLNSVLQVLRYTPQFEENLHELAHQIKLSKRERELIAELQQNDVKKDDDKDIDTWDVVVHLSEVFSKMKQAELNVMNGSCFIGTRPYDLIDIIGHLNPVFEGDQQQDAHEFLRCLLAYVQDASRSLNRYRRKAAEGLGRPVQKCVIEEKSVLASPKEVDLFGGSKSSPAQDSSTEKNGEKHANAVDTRTQQIPRDGRKDENSVTCEENKLQTSSFKRDPLEHKLLSELQNHSYPGQKSLFEFHDVNMDQSRVRCETTCAGEVDICQKKGSIGQVNNIKRSYMTKRKAHCCTCETNTGVKSASMVTKGGSLLTRKKRRFSPGVKDVSRAQSMVGDGHRDSRRPEVLNGSTPDLRIQMNGDTVNCGSKGKQSQPCKKPSPKQQETKPSAENGTCSGKPEAMSDANDEVKISRPVMKELFVRLDKNGIDRYFRKVSKPQDLVDLDRHTDPVSDCVEELFQGCVELRTRCCECEKVTARKEDYQDISVAIEKKHQEDDDEDDEEEPVGRGGEHWLGELEERKGDKVVSQDLDSAENRDKEVHLDEDVSPSPELVKGLRSSGGRRCMKTEEDFTWIKKSLEEVEHLREDSKYWCESCCHLSEAERSMHYTSVPKVLTLHLKRFAVLNGSHRMFTKLTHHMPLPMLLSCIEDNCLTPEQHRLQLYGVIMHTGSTLSGGHYTAYVRAPTNCPGLSHRRCLTDEVEQNDERVIKATKEGAGNSDDAVTSVSCQYTNVWFACDDDVIRILPEKEFISLLNQGSKYTMTPYLLFYHRF